MNMEQKNATEKAMNDPVYLRHICNLQAKEIDRLSAIISEGWSSRDKRIAELEKLLAER